MKQFILKFLRSAVLELIDDALKLAVDQLRDDLSKSRDLAEEEKSAIQSGAALLTVYAKNKIQEKLN